MIQIIPATTADLSLIETISIQTFTETFAPLNTAQNLATYIAAHFNPTTLKNELENSQSAFFFAKANNQILGYLKVNWGLAQTESLNEEALEIQRIYVLQEFQGQQIGQQLLLQAIAIAKNKKVDSIWLGVWENNKKALQFYKKNGFEAFDKHVFTLGNEVQTDLLLRYQLKK
jgi:ribosomal protein S18 acetylase RimI-like enzyme